MTTEEAPWALAPKWFNELNVFKLVRHVADFCRTVLECGEQGQANPNMGKGLEKLRAAAKRRFV